MMDPNEKKAQEAERDRCWAEIRRKRGELVNMIAEGHKPVSIDFILFFQCLTLVLADICLYEEEFLDVDEETKKIMEDPSPGGALQRIIREAKYWKAIEDEQNSSDKKMEAVEGLRKSLWGNMSVKKTDILGLLKNFPSMDSPNEFALLLQCVSMVILELDLKEKEIEILQGE